MKHFFFTILIFLSNTVKAQDGYLKIDTVNRGEQFSFPVVTSGDTLVRNKINIHLQLSELEYIADELNADIFDEVTTEMGGLYGAKDAIQQEVLVNTNRCLAIRLEEAGCGMTCHYWTRYYNFNPQNGDRYQIADLFQPHHLQKARVIISTARKQKLAEQIKVQIEADTFLKYLEQYIYDAITEDDLDDFYFDEDSIYFDNDNLLTKNDKFYELDQVTGIAIEDLKLLLNEYGSSVLITGKDLRDHRAITEPQLYEGTIGKYPIYMLFRQSYEDSYYGIYAYKKQRKGIDLDGKLEDDTYSMAEKDEDLNETAMLTFRKTNNKLTGHWKGKPKGNELPFSAARK